ncbi:sterol regulatory element binding protein cleavage-activating protein [Flagelloscypha sp. PMI_526]|nr:sterol regulatory element binding protein cleavage-activating protein [Flagelloscypha sp. PMI_526]
MLNSARGLLAVAREYGHWFFLHFGLHVATHQIRVILISSVVITSLFYPALASYYSSPYSSLSVLTNFVEATHNRHDLTDLWTDYHSLRYPQGWLLSAFVWNRAVPCACEHEDSALDHSVLLRTLELERTLNNLAREQRLPCLRPTRQEIHDKDALLGDKNPRNTIAPWRNVSSYGMTITPSMVLAGRGELYHDGTFDHAGYLALTYLFDSLQLQSPATAQVIDYRQPPALYYSRPEGWTALSIPTVHSRFVEIAASTITSISLLLLVGFKVTLVPWELLPIVMMFVGAENMMSLPEPQILSNWCPTIPILGIIAFFSVGALKQFCVFAIVVLGRTLLFGPPDLKALSFKDRVHLALKNLAKGRATKNMSLVLLLAITATLYYSTYPSHFQLDPTEMRPTLSSLSRMRASVNHSAYKRLWSFLNPDNTSPFHLRLQDPVFRRHNRFIVRTIRRFWWFIRIMDTDRLEAQKHRAAAGEPDAVPKERTLEGKMSFTNVPRAYTSDIDLRFHWPHSGRNLRFNIAHILQSAPSTSAATSAVVAIAVDDSGEFCAVGTAAGMVGIWRITETSINLLHSFASGSVSGTAELGFLYHQPRTPPPKLGLAQDLHPPALLAIFEDGAVLRSHDYQQTPVVPPSSLFRTLKATLLPTSIENDKLVAFILEDGKVDVVHAATSVPVASLCHVASENDNIAADNVGSHFVLAAATETGFISLWDLRTSALVASLDDPYPRVSRLRVFANNTKTCHLCGQPPPQSYTMALSGTSVLQVFTIFCPSDTLLRHCTCIQTRPRPDASVGRRSRSGSNSATSSPLLLRKKLSMNFEQPFPVSGHGLHSRRASDKESSSRRGSETLYPGEEHDHRRSSSEATGSSVVKRGTISWLMDIELDRGSWGTADGCLIGVRRLPRTIHPRPPPTRRKPPKDPSYGLSFATLDRWEAWRLDPSTDLFSSSALTTLYTFPPSRSRVISSQSAVPRLPFTRVTPFVAHDSHAVSGFGNTVGILRNL